MICPKCGSRNVRESRSSRWSDYRWLAVSQQMYRCRECRLRFHAKELGKEGSENDDGAAAHASHREHRHVPRFKLPKKIRHRLVEAVVFAVMLVLFILFLRYLIQERPADSDSGRVSPEPAQFRSLRPPGTVVLFPGSVNS